MDVEIGDLTAPDLTTGFLEALASLAEVKLSPDEAQEVLRQRLRVGQHTFVARAQGKVVGTASLLVERKFIHTGGKVGHIEDVAVHPDFQKKGIGTQLVQHATNEARKLGCYKVILNCFDRLVPFYARIGYRLHDAGLRIDL